MKYNQPLGELFQPHRLLGPQSRREKVNMFPMARIDGCPLFWSESVTDILKPLLPFPYSVSLL